MRVRVVPYVDALDVDDERVVLLESRALLLSAVASVVHGLLVDGETVEAAVLLERVAQVLPLPEEPLAALETLLADLAEQGLLEVVV